MVFIVKEILKWWRGKVEIGFRKNIKENIWRKKIKGIKRGKKLVNLKNVEELLEREWWLVRK